MTPTHRMFRAAAILAIALFFAASAGAADTPRPPMFAAYYVWYSTAQGDRGAWNGWAKPGQPSSINPKGHDPDKLLFPPYIRDISSAAYPLLGVYDSDDPEVCRWHIKLAKASGISAFMVSWWGPGKGKRQGLTQSAFEVLLRTAEQEHFHIALMDETAQFVSDFETVKRWAAEYLAKYKDSPAYLKIDDKPVYYLYQVSFDPRLTTDTFSQLKQHVEDKVGNVYWIVDKISNANNRFHIPAGWLAEKCADSYACYGTFSNFREWRFEDLIGRYSNLVEQAHHAGLKMMLPVHPGHDNSRLRETDYFVMPRDQGQTLRGYLRAVRESAADFVLVTSFNEWPETTVVEPAVTWDDPYLYLRILAGFNGIEFKPPAEPQRAIPIEARPEIQRRARATTRGARAGE